MKGLTFVLTVDMGKRLIAKGLMAEPEVQRVLKDGRLLCVCCLRCDCSSVCVYF